MADKLLHYWSRNLLPETPQIPFAHAQVRPALSPPPDAAFCAVHAPAGRLGHAFAYDEGDGRILLVPAVNPVQSVHRPENGGVCKAICQ